jgi:hypothetical protein
MPLDRKAASQRLATSVALWLWGLIFSVKIKDETMSKDTPHDEDSQQTEEKNSLTLKARQKLLDKTPDFPVEKRDVIKILAVGIIREATEGLIK